MEGAAQPSEALTLTLTSSGQETDCPRNVPGPSRQMPGTQASPILAPGLILASSVAGSQVPWNTGKQLQQKNPVSSPHSSAALLTARRRLLPGTGPVWWKTLSQLRLLLLEPPAAQTTNQGHLNAVSKCRF